MQETAFGPVRFIPGPNRGKYPFCHSIYIEGDRILIDPAADRERLAQLRREEGVREVWLSHWHEDHFMHLDLFEDLPVRIHPADAAPLADLDTFLDAYGIEEPAFREHFGQMVTETFHFQPRTPRPDLVDGLRLQLSAVTVEVIHTPGHTPGHVCLYFREPGVLYMGDYDLAPFGPCYGDRDSHIAQTIQSIARLRRIPARTWLAAHETGVFEQAPDALWDAYLAVIERRAQKLRQYLAAPRRFEDIVDQWIVFWKAREPIDFFRWAEAAMIKKHLEEMTAAGTVIVENGRYRRA